MANLFRRMVRRDISTVGDYAEAMSYAGHNYSLHPHVQQTMTGEQVEQPGYDLMAFSRRMYANNGIVYACMSMRAHVFSAIRFAFQRFEQTRPSTMFGTRALRLFEHPWTGGSAQDLLALIIQDIDLAGNSYWVRRGNELVHLPADQVDIVLRLREDGLGYETAGYMHWPNGRNSGRGIALRVGEVAHVTPPTRDPFAPYKGMSWMRTVFSEIATDNLMERHKSKLFENGATPNMVVKFGNEVDDDSFDEYVAKFRRAHDGAQNAGKTLFLTPGMDMEVVGKDFQQLDFSGIQGHAETRIAAAAGVPPQIIPLSEGMQGSSLNANVYSSARRRFADATMHPLWQSTVSALAVLAEDLGSSARLWYDTRDVPFIREDEADVAEIQQNRAQTIRTLVDAGYEAESAVNAVNADDFGLLQHSGLFSVQLHPPGSSQSVTDPAESGSSEEGSS